MRRLWSIPAALVLLTALAGVAAAQGPSTPDTPATAPSSLLITLAPILAAATAVERTLESVFNFLEATALTVIARLAMGAEWLGWATLEVDSANDAIRAASVELRQIVARERQAPATADATAGVDPALLSRKAELLARLDTAEGWLRDSEQRIQDTLKSPNYTRMKQVTALVLGVIFGTILTLFAQLDILSLLGVTGRTVPGLILTGFIVGTGTGPVHSLITLLQQVTNTVDRTRAFLNGKALSEAADAIVTANGGMPAGGTGDVSREVGAEATGPGRTPVEGTLSPRQARTLRRLID